MKNYCNICKVFRWKVVYRCFMTQNSYSAKTHYEVLGVPSNSTTKEIKQAYVKLCKELHPDKRPNDAAYHKKFLQLNEAYTTLVKTHSRKQYDLNLASQRSYNPQSFSNYYRSSEYYHPNSFEEGKYGPYEYGRRYGPYEHARWSESNSKHFKDNVKNEQRQNNIIIATGCLVLMVLGMLGHYAAFTTGRTFSEKKLDERIISDVYMKVRERAIHSKNKEQLDDLKEHLTVKSIVGRKDDGGEE